MEVLEAMIEILDEFKDVMLIEEEKESLLKRTLKGSLRENI